MKEKKRQTKTLVKEQKPKREKEGKVAISAPFQQKSPQNKTASQTSRATEDPASVGLHPAFIIILFNSSIKTLFISVI